MEPTNVTFDMAEFGTMLKASFLESIKELGLDKVDRKHAIIPGIAEDENLTKDQRIKLALKDWVHGLYARDNVLIGKALTGLTTSGLGFVPEEFRVEVIRVAENFGLMRKLGFVFPTDLLTINLHAANGVISVTWVDAGSAISESDATFTEPTMTIKKAAAISAMYKELFADAKFPIVSYLAELYGEAIAGAEDSQALVGTGSPFHGLIGGTISGQVTTTATGVTSYVNFTADHLLDTAMGVVEKYRNGAGYFMHPTVFSYIRRIKDTNGNYIVQMPTSPSDPASIWGYPVYTSEKCPSTDASNTKFVGFANPKRLFFADREEMEMEISDQATLTTAGNLWEKHMTAVKFTERIALLWTLGAGTAVLKTSA